MADVTRRANLENFGITIENGTSYTFDFVENPTTGFSWNVEPASTDAGIFTVDPKYIQDDSPDCYNCTGVGGRKWITITAVKAGSVDLDVVHMQPWNPDRPVDSVSIPVTVI